METIRKTVESKYAPKQTNVIWVDTSGDTPVEKHFIKGKWREMSGGGAGSSNPTEADAIKVWQVTPVLKETKIEETVIVPEQTLVNNQELEYNDKFVLGAQCVAVIDGIEYRGEVFENGKGAYIFEAEFGAFIYDPNEEIFYFFNSNDIEHPEVTAKLSVIEEVPDYDYNWAPGVKIPIPTAEDEDKILVVTKVGSNYEYQLQENAGGGGGSNILYCEGSDDRYGLITAYIDSSELENPQITTIAVNTGENTKYFYRMSSSIWLVSGFNTFADSNEWVKEWNTEGQYPTIVAYFSSK